MTAIIVPFPTARRRTKIWNTACSFVGRQHERSRGVPYLQAATNGLAKQLLRNGVDPDAVHGECLAFIHGVVETVASESVAVDAFTLELEATGTSIHVESIADAVSNR